MDLVVLKQTLEVHAMRSRLIQHPYFKGLESAHVSRSLAARLIGQWWHPLHYFPTFLSRTIAVTSSLGVRTAISRILFQELGEGAVERAHERLYVTTMEGAGFTVEQIAYAEPLQATRALISGYREASGGEFTGIGFLYATEVADLSMVSGIGTAVRRAVGPVELEWVDIHVHQEPVHVNEASSAVAAFFSPAQASEIIQAAETAWALWIGFFDTLAGLLAEPLRAA